MSMSPGIEDNMSTLMRLWTKVARFARALEGIDDPNGHYMFSLEKRINKLERDAEHFERQLRSRAGCEIQQ